jgi:ParB family transcriptional regulator, chromosome partitioning protein
MAEAKKKKAAAKAPKKPGMKTRRGIKIKPSELTPAELAVPLEGPLAELGEQVKSDGGAVLASYREPLGGHSVLLVALPLDKVAPTPYQRDVSDAHVRKLTRAMDKTRRYLDPIIAVKAADGYQTPNGNHRLTVLRELGATSIVALLVPEREVAYQILALNIEKAHNLRERALEVVRMYRDLMAFQDRPESECELELEEPALVTLGFSYEQKKRLSGGAYAGMLKRVDGWIAAPLSRALGEREKRAKTLLAFDEAVDGAVTRLREAGFTSPYLKNFVVSRVDPSRFQKAKEGGPAPGSEFHERVAKMTERAAKLDAGKIRVEDVARSGGAPEPEA